MPEDSGDVVVIANGATIVMERLAEAVCWGLPASFTVTFAMLVAAAVGVPLITPVLALIVSPAGRPVADPVYGVVPPLAARVALQAVLAMPDVSGNCVVITTVVPIVMERLADAVS